MRMALSVAGKQLQMPVFWEWLSPEPASGIHGVTQISVLGRQYSTPLRPLDQVSSSASAPAVALRAAAYIY